MIKKGSYVTIKKVVLNKNERSINLPADTKKVDLIMKIKGTTLHDAQFNEIVEIMTTTKRIVKGELVELNPRYVHSFGSHIEEIEKIKSIILKETETL